MHGIDGSRRRIKKGTRNKSGALIPWSIGPSTGRSIAVLVLVFMLALAGMLGVVVIVSMLTTILVTTLVATPLIVIIASDPDEVHRLAASVVLAAMLGPLFGMARWYMKIEWRLLDQNCGALNDDRLCIDQRRRWRVANVDAAIDARLQLPRDCGADIGDLCPSNARHKRKTKDSAGEHQMRESLDRNVFHDFHSL